LTHDRIAQSNAVLLIPEGERIEETLGVGILELQRPGLAVVGRFVDS
jgi:hypothetical protein